MPDVSIAISAKDNFTEALRKMMSGTESFHKDLGELQTDLNRLNGTKASLKVDLADARRELQTARKEFERLGDAASRTKFEAAQGKFDNLQSNLRLVSRGAQQAERDMQSLAGTVNKTQNRFGSSSSNTGGAISTGIDLGGDSLLKRLAGAGLSKMVGDTLSAIGGAYIGSAFGSRGGNLVSSALTGAGTGAAIGSIVPVIGTGVGAVVGGALGTVQGAAQNFGAKDDSFKSFVQEQVDSRLSEQQDMLLSGSSIAAQRETDLTSFSTLFGGKATAKKYLDQVQQLANSTPFLYYDLTGMSKTLKTFGYRVNEMIPTLTTIGDTGAALGMGTGDMNTVAQALGRMRNTSSVTRETMDMLRDRGIDAYGYLANAQGVDKGALDGMISKGKISGADAAKTILQAMTDAFGGAMQQQSETFSGLTSTLEGMNQELENAMGAGYNDARKAGLQQQISFLQGDDGKTMQDAYSAIGAWKASLENTKESMVRDAMRDAMNSQAYKTATKEGDQAEVGRILAAAQTKGMMEYNATEGAQQEAESQRMLAETVRNDAAANSAYWDAGYQLGESFAKGRAAAATQSFLKDVQDFSWTESMGSGTLSPAQQKNAAASAGALKSGDVFRSASYFSDGLLPGLKVSKHAFGLQRVPRDDFPTLLHAGERVLTAQQARQQDAQDNGVQVHVHGLSVREEADVDKIAAAIVTKLATARAARRP